MPAYTNATQVIPELFQQIIGMALPLEAPLQPVPADLARSAPGLEGLQYQIAGNQLILVEPIYRQVLAVIAP